MPSLPNWIRELRELPCEIREIKVTLAAIQDDQVRIQRALTKLVQTEAHEAEVLAAIQSAIGAVDIPPGKLEAINTIIQANLKKLRGVIASAPPTALK